LYCIFNIHNVHNGVNIVPTDYTYEFLVEEQPIGCRLFYMFCERDPELSKCVQFIEALNGFSLGTEEKAVSTANQIYEQYVSTSVSMSLLCTCNMTSQEGPFSV